MVSTRNGDWCEESDGQLASVCPKARSKPIGSWRNEKKGETKLQLHRLNNEDGEEDDLEKKISLGFASSVG